MLMLICCYFFLAFFAVVLHSPRILWFSFPTLTPAVWLNQSDRLWVPGESLSLHSPLSQVYAFCDKLILASFRKAALSVGQPSAVSSHSSLHTKTKCTKSVENILCMRHAHTQVHAGTRKHDNMRRHKYTRYIWKGGCTVSPKHTHYLSHPSPLNASLPSFHFKVLFWKAPMHKANSRAHWFIVGEWHSQLVFIGVSWLPDLLSCFSQLVIKAMGFDFHGAG